MTSGTGQPRMAPKAALARWGLCDATLSRLNGGLESQVWKVVTPNGEALLRWSRMRTGGLAPISAEMDWLRRLRDGGMLRTPSPLREPLLDEGGGGAWSLLTWVTGKPSTATLTPPQAAAVGQLLAQVHLCGGHAGHTGATPRKYDAAHFGGGLAVLETALPELRDEAGTRLLRAAVTTSIRHLETLTNRGPTDLHADVHPGNVVWDEQTPGLIDFGRCGTGPAVLDVAMAMHYLDEQLGQALLHGYAVTKEVDTAEQEALTPLRLLAAVDNFSTLASIEAEVTWVRRQVPWLLLRAREVA